jgi:hypothetical protein
MHKKFGPIAYTMAKERSWKLSKRSFRRRNRLPRDRPHGTNAGIIGVRRTPRKPRAATPIRCVREGGRKRRQYRGRVWRADWLAREPLGAPRYCPAPSRSSWWCGCSFCVVVELFSARRRFEKTPRRDRARPVCLPHGLETYRPARRVAVHNAVRAAHEPFRSRLHDRY